MSWIAKKPESRGKAFTSLKVGREKCFAIFLLLFIGRHSIVATLHGLKSAVVDRVRGRGFGAEKFRGNLRDGAGAGPSFARQWRQLDPSIPPIVKLESRIEHLRVAGRFSPSAENVDVPWWREYERVKIGRVGGWIDWWVRKSLSLLKKASRGF